MVSIGAQNAPFLFKIIEFFQYLGAPYHRAKGTKAMLERLRIPIMMSGPYSYDLAPAELFFAEFKKVDVNPN